MVVSRGLDPTASVLSFFGAEVRRYRQLAGLSQEQLGQRVHVSTSLVGMIEKAHRMPSEDFASRCDEVFATGGALERLWPLVSKESYPSWFQPFVELEREATSLREFMPLSISGLLQTEEYAREVLRATRPDYTTDQVEELVAGRMERQAILDRPDPPLLVSLLDESVLTRLVGGPKVMDDQLDALLQAAQRPKVILQVVPVSTGATAGLAGTSVIASFAGASDIVYFESVATGQVVDRPEEVTACTVAYEVLRAAALPQAPSLDLVRTARERFHHERNDQHHLA